MRINLPLHRKVLIFLLPAFFIVFVTVIGYIVASARSNTFSFVSQITEESAEKYSEIIKAKIKSDFDLVEYDVLLDNLNKLINSFDIYGNGNTILISDKGDIVAFPDKNKIGKEFDKEYGIINNKYNILKNAGSRKKTIYSGEDLVNGKNSFIAFIPIEIEHFDKPWYFGLSIPHEFVNNKMKSVLSHVVILSLFGLIVFVILIMSMSRRVINPLLKARDVLEKLSKGEIDKREKLNIETGDEIEDIIKSVNNLIEGLNKTAEFAKNIGQGNLNADYENLGENDDLGNSLLEMRQSLLAAADEDKKRKIEDDKHNWATQGMAKFGEILRQHNQDIEGLSFNIMSNLVDYVGSIQGGLFVKNDNDDDDEVLFELTAAIAYNRQKVLEKQFKIGEGLIGRCAYEKLSIYMEDVPDDYVHITSGLGESNPRSILIVPAILNDEVYALIELISFNKFEKHHIEFVEKIGESIASTIANARVNSRTNKLLEQSKQQSEELAAQEEEMRQNMEELQATQEEMSRKEEESRKLIKKMQVREEQLNQILDEIEIEEDEIRKRIEKIKKL